MGVAFLVLAVRLGGGEARLHRAAVRLLALHVGFSLLKLTAYDEPEALGFIAYDLLLLGLLTLPATRRRLHG